MSSGDVVKALGPGTKLQSLSSFAPEYKSVSAAFNELLVFPHLETISISDDPTDTQNLRSVVVDGQAKLVGLTDIDVKLARNVVAYSSTLEALLPALQIALLVATMQPIAQGYADEARTQMNANLKFFGELSDYITELDRRIGDMSTKLTQLDKAIKDQSEALAKLNIGKALYDIFKEIFKLSSNLDESNIQISQLLNLDVSTLQGSFSTLFADRIKLQQVLDSLTYMRNQISSLQKKFTVLSNSLTSVTVSSASLLDVWDDVADRMSAVSDDQSTATPAQIQTLTNQWSAVSNDANAYIKALTDTTFLVKDFAALRSQFGTFKKVPVTKHELAVYKLAVAAGIIGDVGVEKAISQYVAANDQISAAANVSDEDAKIVKGVLGPPTDAKEQLDELADRTGKIVDQFNTLLQQPYLEQLACTNPLDGSETNIFVMVTGFKQEYVALQQKTLPVARDLQAYAELQIALLPIVVAKDPKPGNLTLENFIATNKPLVDDYLVKASELSAESTAIQKKWDNAIAVVQKAINECTSNIEKWQASVDQLSEELKKVKLYAALAAAGAFIAFTAAVFLPGLGMLAALGVGGVLGALSIKEAIDASKLIQAINELKSAIKNEEATRAKLESLLPYMTNIAKSLSQVSQIWSDIATALTTLNNFYAVLGGPTGSIILDTLRPTIIESWKTVSASVKAYIDAVAK